LVPESVSMRRLLERDGGAKCGGHERRLEGGNEFRRPLRKRTSAARSRKEEQTSSHRVVPGRRERQGTGGLQRIRAARPE
jgi:hypothetical protein